MIVGVLRAETTHLIRLAFKFECLWLEGPVMVVSLLLVCSDC